MIALVVLIGLMLYVPVRVMKPFPISVKAIAWLIVAIKTIIIIAFHFNQLDTGNHPIVLDQSIDAKKYYDVSSAVTSVPWWQFRHADLIEERGASGHLGYYYLNIVGFYLCPDHPMLFVRLLKLFAFCVSTGMLATVWLRRTGSVGRAFFGYFLLTVAFYQFMYFTFRNLKDDIILALFIATMALIDGYLINPDLPAEQKTRRKTVFMWIAVGGLIYVMASMRFYAGLAVVCGLAAHTVIGPGMKMSTRVVTSVVFLVGIAGLMATSGGALVAAEGGAGAVLKAAADVGGLFKIIVTPVPWQHPIRWQIPAHLVYLLFLLPMALIAFFLRIRDCLDWKFVVVVLLMLVVGGHIHDFAPRKRFMMYPVFTSWIIMMGRRQTVGDDETEPFDVDAYFARHGALT